MFCYSISHTVSQGTGVQGIGVDMVLVFKHYGFGIQFLMTLQH